MKFPKWYHLIDYLIIMLVLFTVCLGFSYLLEQQNYRWQWYRIPEYLYFIHKDEFYFGPFLRGFGVTLQISGIAIVLCAVLGFVIMLMQNSKLITLRFIARSYIEIIRNIPILVLLLLFYFVIAAIFGVSRFWSGVLTLAIYEAAFAAEIYRAGIG
ncbi:MAG: ABC transporter permease subunit, partial [Rhizobiales bacterium]|nr:ABC transporter permease subunit [Hyphomicrobiales bacterium]